jgi:hypothetical protein
VVLSANTVYGVDVGLHSSTSDWSTGIPYVHFTANVCITNIDDLAKFALNWLNNTGLAEPQIKTE